MNDSQCIEVLCEIVWVVFNDLDVLKVLIFGCEELIKYLDIELEVKVKLKVGLVKVIFGGKVMFNDFDLLNGYRIEGEGFGGVVGFVCGGVKVSLEEDGFDVIIFYYGVDVKVGGKFV